ncbi:nitronate monooxygenase [Methylobacterium sp. 17Sr1-1]|uniref:NAD(P)H-dependent flavin oxidoreductase n=1 Tax=Methylobacterium sp. 17Sr1-1 TaxID=2202826 RepID=UPI000D6FFE04|nr:nitronate monooxygenase [Methylobacterium sp. 17Sr1-1]AWN54405.1 nitronate monooxygenase [Methylobacterium sp. 17Sr1-1]
MSAHHPALARAEAFAALYGLRRPLLLAPMAGACPPALSLAVMRAGGLGACGALLMQPAAILAWADAVREAGPFQINLWIPDPAPARDPDHEARLRAFLGRFGPAVPPEAGDAAPPDFTAQCEALIAARPRVVSSIMGLYPPAFVARLKERGIAWWATATTVAEALAAEAAGADAVVVQGAEAGGHRGAFRADQAEAQAVGLMALLPAVVDAVSVPVVATGGIAEARGAAAALLLGASAVQIGTGFLRCPEAGIPSAWADGLGRARPEETRLTRAFSGRTGRSLATDYVAAAAAPDAPVPAPYPVQRGLTQAMREAAVKEGDLSRMQAWAGQAAGLARAVPAGEVVEGIWEETQGLLR